MFKLTIKTDNVAFVEGDKGNEVARILASVAKKLKAGLSIGLCMDYNGNTVGSFRLTGKP